MKKKATTAKVLTNKGKNPVEKATNSQGNWTRPPLKPKGKPKPTPPVAVVKDAFVFLT